MQTLLRRAGVTRALPYEEIALTLITMVWGATFLIVHLAMQECGPFLFVGVRFVVAGVAAGILFRDAMTGLTRREAMAGVTVGVAIFLSYALQTEGLRTVTASQGAFITAIYVPLVPLLQLFVLRRPPHAMAWVSIALAFAGLVLIAGPDAGGFAFTRGELATLLGAIAIGCEVILIGHFAGKVDSRRVTVVQLLVGGLLSLAAMPVAGEALPGFSWFWVTCAVGLGLSSAVIQLTMNWAQKSLSPTRATVIYAAEPVWGGLAGWLAGDRLTMMAILGAGLIVMGVLIGEWRPKRTEPDIHPSE